MKMKYQITWSKKADENIGKLDKDAAERIMKKLDAVAEDPFSFVKRLKGCDFYRLRVGDYRVIMAIENKRMIIFVVEVGHRSVIYRKY
jgi:mRNA interferase RelE/StbE